MPFVRRHHHYAPLDLQWHVGGKSLERLDPRHLKKLVLIIQFYSPVDFKTLLVNCGLPKFRRTHSSDALESFVVAWKQCEQIIATIGIKMYGADNNPEYTNKAVESIYTARALPLSLSLLHVAMHCKHTAIMHCSPKLYSFTIYLQAENNKRLNASFLYNFRFSPIPATKFSWVQSIS